VVALAETREPFLCLRCRTAVGRHALLQKPSQEARNAGIPACGFDPGPLSYVFLEGHGYVVAYLLDGSVRKSGAKLRVAARLIRAENGYVVWSETYDRRLEDILTVQEDIAGEATKALRASIEAGPGR
jgi:hypothetical protein